MLLPDYFVTEQKLPTDQKTEWRNKARALDKEEEEGSAGKVRPPGLDPLIFHASNIVLHTVVSGLVCW